MNTSVEDKIVRYLSGNMSELEKTSFEAELRASDSLRAAYSEYDSIWKLTNTLDHDYTVTQASWHSFKDQVTTSQPSQRIGLYWVRVAASITILAVFTTVMWFLGSTDISFTSHNTIQNHIFVDETEVMLNKNSSLSSADGYNEEHRTVRLVGQAYFDVAKSDQAFRVETNSGDVIVYGTQFDVYTDDKVTTVELHEGSVRYQYEDKDITLMPGERLIVMDGAVAKSTITTKLEWGEGIVCVDMPLAYILGQLKINYSVGYNVKSRFLKEHYTVSLPKDNLQACLQILNDIVGENFALLDGRIVLN
ncbi:FecR domain-containing protein [Bacteroidia bacterium]|nr:FecR domain-containing protein [Bacteroidia bacterium]